MTADDKPIVRNIPNALTVFRLLLVPVFIGMFVIERGTSIQVGAVFWIASITDFFDGLIARKAQIMSQFGKIADPIADRLLVNSAIILLCIFDDRMLGWEWVIVVARDIGAMYGYYRTTSFVVPTVSITGKVGMASMMGGLALLWILPSAIWPLWLFEIGLSISLFALVGYVRRYSWVLDGK